MATTVEILSRPDCCLCDEAKKVIERVAAEYAIEVRVVDISGNSELEARYGHEIPVVFVGGRKAFKYRVDEAELRRRLSREAA